MPSKLRKGRQISSEAQQLAHHEIDNDAFDAALDRIIQAKTLPSTPAPASDSSTILSTPSSTLRKKERRKSKLNMSWVPGQDSDGSPAEASADLSHKTKTMENSVVVPSPSTGMPSTTPQQTLDDTASAYHRAVSLSPLPQPSAIPPSTVATLSSAQSKSPSLRRNKAKDPICPVCLIRPSHPRSSCRIITAGADSIDFRIVELESEFGDPELVKELKELRSNARAREKEVKAEAVRRLRKDEGESKVSDDLSGEKASASVSSKPLDVRWAASSVSIGGSVSGDDVPKSTASTPKVPAGAKWDEVTVETQDEGSSNEDSDEEPAEDETEDESEDLDEEDDAASGRKEDVDKERVTANDSSSLEERLAAVVRGPRRPNPVRNILNNLHKLFQEEEPKSKSDSEGEEEEAILEDDEEEYKAERARRRRSQTARLARSPSSEPEAVNAIPNAEEEAEDADDTTFMDGGEERPLHNSVGVLPI